MSSVLKSEPDLSAACPGKSPASGEVVGFLVVEQRSSTPLGPKILHANEELSRLSGYENSSLVGSPLGLVYDRADLAGLIDKLPAIAGRSSHCFMDRVLLRNGGTKRMCHWTIRPIRREGEARGYFALTVQPVLDPVERLLTRPKVAETQKATVSPVKSAARSAPRQETPGLVTSHEVSPPDLPDSSFDFARSESISLAAAGVAHDFKNALQTIKMNLDLAALACPAGHRAFNHISEAQLALGDAEMLARQMLACTRGESDRRSVFHIGQLLDRVSRLCSAGSGIRCRIQLPESIRCVEGNPTQIYQVLHNLVINARQAMPTGGTIDISGGNADLEEENRFSMPPGQYTVASVRDRGCGIDPEVLPRIFDAEFTTKKNGSGFGLASCQTIVRNHGGAIRVASKVGVGTEFLVFLPSTNKVADSNPGWPTMAPEESVSRTRPFTGTGRVLVVEDEPGVARSTLGMLKQLGYEALHARYGEEAVSIYREHLDSPEPIDVVLLDMTLPGGLSGSDVANEIRSFDSAARFVATSGYFEEKIVFPRGSEFSVILPKPYGMESLSESLETAIAE